MLSLNVRLDKADTDFAVRIDASTYKNAVRTPQGYLRMPIHATRTGVFTYRNPDGSVRRELRHPEDVFNPRSLGTLAGIPVTDDHPNVKNPAVMLVDSKNTKELQIGYTGDEVKQDGEYVAAWATITDHEAIDAVEKGKQELSCGYLCEREIVAGVYNGEPYDIRQRNIIYNHVALVEKGRAGPNVRLRLDSADAVQVENIITEEFMEKILINGVEHEVSKAVADSIRAEQALLTAEKTKATEAIAAKDVAVARADRAEGKIDSVTTELSKVKQQLEATVDSADPKKTRAAAKTTIKILKAAERVLPKATLDKLDDMDDRAIMVEVIKAEAPSISLDGKSDAYLEGRFDSIVESLKIDPTKTGGNNMGKNLTENRNDAKDGNDEAAAKKRQRESSENRWKMEQKA